METTFIGIYRGRTVAEAELVAVTSQRRIVEQVTRALIGEEPTIERENSSGEPLRLVRARE